MLRIKKLDIFIVKSFAQLFTGTFFICLFIFMMQFLWRYVDELVGKGLEINVLAQFFFLSGLTLIPLSLPLAILLAALMTFGNFGERYELLAMKAAGIPLLRIIRPLVVFCTFLCCISFYFQNVIAPKAQKQLWTLIVSMKQTSPELDIPEGVFYDEIQGYNIYVKKKDRETGILKDVLIYDLSEGLENSHIIWAETGKLELTSDKQHLQLHLYNGEQFENLKSQSIASKNVPYRRETFREKHSIIEFDGGFNMMDGNFLNSRSDIKNMAQISETIDSLNLRVDSVGRALFADAKKSSLKDIELTKEDSVSYLALPNGMINADSLFRAMTLAEKKDVLDRTQQSMTSLKNEWMMKGYQTADIDKSIRSHITDWHKKFTLSLSCLIFFFIGAPLGAIIRKGGLGMPVVVSVVIFLIYYIIDSGATRVAKSGEMNMLLGVWMSSLVLAPMGFFFTYKSNKDSVVFNAELYMRVIRTILGMRPTRHVFKKEVIICDPAYGELAQRLESLSSTCDTYNKNNHLKSAPNYINMFFNWHTDHVMTQINDEMETIIEELSNTKDREIIAQLNNYPILSVSAHKSPFDNRWLNLITGLIVPVGLFFYFRIWMFRLRLNKDLKNMIETNKKIQDRITINKM